MPPRTDKRLGLDPCLLCEQNFGMGMQFALVECLVLPLRHRTLLPFVMPALFLHPLQTTLLFSLFSFSPPPTTPLLDWGYSDTPMKY